MFTQVRFRAAPKRDRQAASVTQNHDNIEAYQRFVLWAAILDSPEPRQYVPRGFAGGGKVLDRLVKFAGVESYG